MKEETPSSKKNYSLKTLFVAATGVAMLSVIFAQHRQNNALRNENNRLNAMNDYVDVISVLTPDGDIQKLQRSQNIPADEKNDNLLVLRYNSQSGRIIVDPEMTQFLIEAHNAAQPEAAPAP